MSEWFKPFVSVPSTSPVTTPPATSTPQSDKQPKVGTQTVGGKSVKWKEGAQSNSALQKSSQKTTSLALRKAAIGDVSRRATDLIYKELGLNQLKPLTPKEQQQVDALVTKLKTSTQGQQKKLDDYQKNVQAKLALAQKTGVDPKSVKLDAAPLKLSDSALLLKDKLAEKVNSGKQSEKNAVASAMIDTLGLKDGQEVTAGHIAKAEKNLARFENSRNTDLFKAFGALTYAQLLKGVIKATEKAGPEHAGSIRKLNDNQLCALHCYTEQVHCDNINGPLRRNEALAPGYQKAMDIATQALKILPPFVGPAYRGCSLPQSIDATLVARGTFQDKAFISSAANLGSAFKGTHQMVIMSQTGRDISFVSALSHEKEILFPPSAQFQVINVQRDMNIPFGPDNKPALGGNTVAEGWGACKFALKEKMV